MCLNPIILFKYTGCWTIKLYSASVSSVNGTDSTGNNTISRHSRSERLLFFKLIFVERKISIDFEKLFFYQIYQSKLMKQFVMAWSDWRDCFRYFCEQFSVIVEAIAEKKSIDLVCFKKYWNMKAFSTKWKYKNHRNHLIPLNRPFSEYKNILIENNSMLGNMSVEVPFIALFGLLSSKSWSYT